MKELVVHLERPVAILAWRITGVVARARQRPELHSLLALARDMEALDAGDVAGQLIGGRPQVAGRMLRIAESLGLIEAIAGRVSGGARGKFTLTPAGHRSLDEKQVFIPESGTWVLVASDDPLLPVPILGIYPLEGDHASREKRNGGTGKFEKMPAWVVDTVGEVFIPMGGEGDALRIDDLGGAGQG